MARHLELVKPSSVEDVEAEPSVGDATVQSSAVMPAQDPDEHPGDDLLVLVYRQMRSLAGPGQDLDDLVQTAAEQAVRSFHSFEGRSEVSTWTFRICYHVLLKHRRWFRRWLRRFAYALEADPPERIDVRPTALESLERWERIRRLWAALSELSPKRRAVVILHDLEGQSVDEIAVIVGAKPGTVRSRLRDGRKCLAQILEQDAYFGDEACRRVEKP